MVHEVLKYEVFIFQFSVPSSRLVHNFTLSSEMADMFVTLTMGGICFDILTITSCV
jgi:hypothetical protein